MSERCAPRQRKGTVRMRKTAATMAAMALLASISTGARAELPVGLEAKAGIGIGYYSMSDFNDNLQELRQAAGTSFEDLGDGFNVMVEGRVWLLKRVAALAGYEHYWSELSAPAGSGTLTYKSPADVLYLGGAVHLIRFPKLIDVNLGVRGSFADVVYGTDETESGRYVEYKSNGYGWDIFAEVNTNFVNPVQVGFTLGYRNLEIDGFEDKFGTSPSFTYSGDDVTIAYSGMYFYFTAGLAVW